MTALDIPALRRTAEAAETLGPWETSFSLVSGTYVSDGHFVVAYKVAPKDAVHIAAWNPSTAIAACDLIDAQTARADKAEHDLARLTVNAGARLDEAKAEIARLEAALATAKRDGWIEGRDAAEAEVRKIAEEFFEEDYVAGRIRALTPPQEPRR